MKATVLAKFFDELSRQQIPFSVDDVSGQSYQEAFGIHKGEGGDLLKADGTYLQVWVEKKSVCDDIVDDFLKKNFPREYTDGTSIEVFDAPTNDVDHNEYIYIIKIND